jgi:hypothetical protein
MIQTGTTKSPRLPWPIATPIPHEACVAGLAPQSLGDSHPLSNPDGRPLPGRFALPALLTVKRDLESPLRESVHHQGPADSPMHPKSPQGHEP